VQQNSSSKMYTQVHTSPSQLTHAAHITVQNASENSVLFTNTQNAKTLLSVANVHDSMFELYVNNVHVAYATVDNQNDVMRVFSLRHVVLYKVLQDDNTIAAVVAAMLK